MQPNGVLLDALVRQLLAMREMADGALHTIAAIRGSAVANTPEGETALAKIAKTFDANHEIPQV